MDTELWISGVSFPRFSSRGCVQELMPITASKILQRSINGELVYLGNAGDVKYRSLIRCDDQDTPILGHLWRGSTLDVGCLSYIHQPLAERSTSEIGGSMTILNRPAIASSLCVFNSAGEKVDGAYKDGAVESSAAQGYVSYRPILSMCLVDFHLSHNEWGAKAGWQLTLEET